MTEIKMVQLNMSNAASESGEWKGKVRLTEFGRVLRPMRADGRLLKFGDVLPPEFVAKLSRQSREALVSNKWIEILPLSAEIAGG
jgi:hypothetical protein